jgi:hypothetical protein
MYSRNRQGELRWSASFYKFLLTAHIIVSVGWLGVVIAKLALKLIAVASGDPATVAALFLAAGRLNLAFPPLAILAIVTGVLLSLGTKWGLLQHYWVVTKLVLTFGVIGTAVQLGSRIPQPTGQPMPDASFLGLAASPVALLLALTATHLVMLAVATILSTYKPWGKTRFARRNVVQPQQARAILAATDRAGSAPRGQQLEGSAE